MNVEEVKCIAARRQREAIQLVQKLRYDTTNNPTVESIIEGLQSASLNCNEVGTEDIFKDCETFKQEFLQKIPANMVVCSITFDVKRHDMYLCRMESGCESVVFKLPLQRQSTRDGETEGLTFDKAMRQFQDIMQESQNTINELKGVENVSRDQIRKWRTGRMALDKRLGSFLSEVESVWLGGFKGLLSTVSFESKGVFSLLDLFKTRLETLILKVVTTSTAARAKLVKFDIGLCNAILRIGRLTDNYKEIEDILYYLMDIYQYSGAAALYDEVNVDTLTEEIKDLIESFYDDLENFHADTSQYRTEKHLVLILDKYAQQIPWESIPILSGKSVSRLPSAQFLAERLTKSFSAGREDVYYVLNPSKDLDKTQERFQPELLG